jgi:pimeloyl-ACP methyl ester carboxylesterase
MAEPYTDEWVDVDGAPIHYLAWGRPGRRGLVFVHGGGAHAHWWTHIAGLFAPSYRVVALDLSGHGDSGRRSTYGLESWAREVVTVARSGGIDGPPAVIGHSMGGFITIVTAAAYGKEIASAIACDSPVSRPDAEIESFTKQAFGKARRYDTAEQAIARFRTLPEQDHNLPYVFDHVARHSICQEDGYWRWKFDSNAFGSFDDGMRGVALPYLSQIRCRFALLRSEYGMVSPQVAAFMHRVQGQVAPVIELPESGHHMMLDQPLVLVTAIRTLLADRDYSVPRPPRGAVG